MELEGELRGGQQPVFVSGRLKAKALVAQRLELLILNQLVAGSNPAEGTMTQQDKIYGEIQGCLITWADLGGGVLWTVISTHRYKRSDYAIDAQVLTLLHQNLRAYCRDN